GDREEPAPQGAPPAGEVRGGGERRAREPDRGRGHGLPPRRRGDPPRGVHRAPGELPVEADPALAGADRPQVYAPGPDREDGPLLPEKRVVGRRHAVPDPRGAAHLHDEGGDDDVTDEAFALLVQRYAEGDLDATEREALTEAVM